MSSSRLFRPAALVALVAFAVGCSDATGPSDVRPADLSEVLAELQPSSFVPINSAISVVPLAGLDAPTPASCSYDGTSRSFVCPEVSIGDIRVSRSFTLLDASGVPQAAFDRTTTAAVRMKTAFAANVTAGLTSMAVEQQQDLTLSGLQTGVHTLNGTSQGHVTGRADDGAAGIPIDLAISTTITNLVLPRSSSGDRWPLSGTIAATITDASGGTRVTTAVGIVFSGTSRVLVTITANGVTRTSTVDLADFD